MTPRTINPIDRQPVRYLIWSNRTHPDDGAPVFGKACEQAIGGYLTTHDQRMGLLVPDSYFRLADHLYLAGTQTKPGRRHFQTRSLRRSRAIVLGARQMARVAATWRNCAEFRIINELYSPVCGAMVQRLARGPFKAEIRVRFPLALPSFFASK